MKKLVIEKCTYFKGNADFYLFLGADLFVLKCNFLTMNCPHCDYVEACSNIENNVLCKL